MDCWHCNKMYAFRHFLRSHSFNTGKSLLGASNPLKIFHILPRREKSYTLYSTNIKCSNTNKRNGAIAEGLRFGPETRRRWICTGATRLLSDGEREGVVNNNNNNNNSYNNHINGEESYAMVGRKKSKKAKTVWVCENCGQEYGQWWGTCQACKRVSTMKRFTEPLASPNWEVGGGGAGSRVAEAKVASFKQFEVEESKGERGRGWLAVSSTEMQPESLSEVIRGASAHLFRLPLPGNFGMEVGRVLGGGLVIGSLVLVGGDPGVGKSTLLLQIGALLAEGCESYKPEPVLYVSGEESVEQIGSRGARMNIESDRLHLYSSTDIEDILDKVQMLRPRAVIVDSIQTVYLREIAGSAGSVSQVKECATALLRFAKKTHIPIFLVGHVTKSGDIAGPRVLEHIVDVVLYMEGERLLSHRLLRAVKNRFGSIDEIGVLEMVQTGLQPVINPSELYLGERNINQDVLAGLAVAVIIDGSRPFLIETQALCCTGVSITRRYNGVQESRADMIIAVLIKQAGLRLQDQAVFLNVVGGVRITETAGDLAIAASICSSFLEMPIPSGIAFIGEIGLAGELRAVSRMSMRISELAKLGFTKCVIPKLSINSIAGFDYEGISIVYCNNVKEMIERVFPDLLSPDLDTPLFQDLGAP